MKASGEHSPSTRATLRLRSEGIVSVSVTGLAAILALALLAAGFAAKAQPRRRCTAWVS